MKLENTKSQMRKGILEYCVLNLISKGEIYSSDIINALKDAEVLVVEGTIYPILTRIKNAKLVTYVWKESTQGPPRKYFKITEEGQVYLENLDKTWTRLNRGVGNIQKLNTEKESIKTNKEK